MEDVLKKSQLKFLDHPIKQDVTNWSDVCNLLEFVLEEALQVNVRDHPILLTEIGLMPKKHREKVTEVSCYLKGIPCLVLSTTLRTGNLFLKLSRCFNLPCFNCTQKSGILMSV